MNAEPLPPLNKQVVYLDQLAISEIFKVKSGTRSREAHNRKFWEDVERSVTRAYLLQQVIFPASSIHMDETIVAPFAGELRLVHEMLGGDTSFASVDEVEMCQVRVFADAYLQNRPPPQLSFDRDHILEGERNAWLPDLHITVDMDLSHFADRIRASRDATATEFAALAQAWVTEKPTFAQALKHELRSYGSVNKQALAYANSQVRRGIETDNIMDVIGGQNHRIRRQFNELKGRFEEAGIPPERSTVEVMKYWDWPGNEQLPVHRIASYLFAALARRVASGGQKRFSRGIMNDIKAISTYGPYVDAMFLDKECAILLSEGRLRTDVNLKGKVFSTKSGDAFLEYLRDLEAGALEEVRRYAEEIYGLP